MRGRSLTQRTRGLVGILRLGGQYLRKILKFYKKWVPTLMYQIKGSTRLGLQRVFSTKNLLIRHQPIYFKRKFHPRQDVYYILFAILFSNISKTYKSKTLIVNHFCPGRLYFFKNPSESHLLWTRLLLGT